MTGFLPWQLTNLRNLVKRVEDNALPHAMLLTGNRGLGKLEFAQNFAHLLLCESQTLLTTVTSSTTQVENLRPCGHCHSCKLVSAGTHPDLRIVEPESDAGIIGIDQIRQLREFFLLKCQVSQAQVAIISPADKLNNFSANGLLKTLEEPTHNSYLLLVSHAPYRLLPTIRSRCQIVRFNAPSREIARDWLLSQDLTFAEKDMEQLLTLSAGAPLTARKYLQDKTIDKYREFIRDLEKLQQNQIDPVSLVSKYLTIDPLLIINWLSLLTFNMVRLKLKAPAVDISNNDNRLYDPALIAKIDASVLFEYLDKLNEYTRLLESQVNVQLSLEDIIIEWSMLQNHKSVPFPV